MRIIEFKMERENLVLEGDKVKVTEGTLPSSYYYTVEPAVAMSANFAYNQRLKTREGIVREVLHTDRGFFLKVEFDE